MALAKGEAIVAELAKESTNPKAKAKPNPNPTWKEAREKADNGGEELKADLPLGKVV